MEDSEKLQEQKINSTKVFNGRLLHVFKDEVRLPDGETSTREYIKHPGAAAVVPVFSNGDIMLVRQFRYPLQQAFYEVPAGKIDAGEDPEKTAVRELKEETGLVCGRIEPLAPFHPSIGYTNEVIHLYCAWDITESERESDDDEFLLIERMPFREAVEMVYDGKITDGKSMVSLLLARHWWQNEGPFEIPPTV
jgi:ADP-ribose pyrophosphatase